MKFECYEYEMILLYRKEISVAPLPYQLTRVPPDDFAGTLPTELPATLADEFPAGLADHFSTPLPTHFLPDGDGRKVDCLLLHGQLRARWTFADAVHTDAHRGQGFIGSVGGVRGCR